MDGFTVDLSHKVRELMSTIICKEKSVFLAHLHSGNQFSFPRLILEGKIAGKGSPGVVYCNIVILF